MTSLPGVPKNCGSENGEPIWVSKLGVTFSLSIARPSLASPSSGVRRTPLVAFS